MHAGVVGIMHIGGMHAGMCGTCMRVGNIHAVRGVAGMWGCGSITCWRVGGEKELHAVGRSFSAEGHACVWGGVRACGETMHAFGVGNMNAGRKACMREGERCAGE